MHGFYRCHPWAYGGPLSRGRFHLRLSQRRIESALGFLASWALVLDLVFAPLISSETPLSVPALLRIASRPGSLAAPELRPCVKPETADRTGNTQ